MDFELSSDRLLLEHMDVAKDDSHESGPSASQGGDRLNEYTQALLQSFRRSVDAIEMPRDTESPLTTVRRD